MKISALVEGKTELAFKAHLHDFLAPHLAGRMPRLDFRPYDGRIATKDRLRRIVDQLLTLGNTPADAVIALTDVYTGTSEFVDAADAKDKMRAWVGNNQRFHPHVALHDFEAWLLPYWDEIQQLAGHNRNAPPGNPEAVNHLHPPSYHVREIFRLGKGRSYSKPRDANRILRGKDLSIAGKLLGVEGLPEYAALAERWYAALRVRSYRRFYRQAEDVWLPLPHAKESSRRSGVSRACRQTFTSSRGAHQLTFRPLTAQKRAAR